MEENEVPVHALQAGSCVLQDAWGFRSLMTHPHAPLSFTCWPWTMLWAAEESQGQTTRHKREAKQRQGRIQLPTSSGESATSGGGATGEGDSSAGAGAGEGDTASGDGAGEGDAFRATFTVWCQRP